MVHVEEAFKEENIPAEQGKHSEDISGEKLPAVQFWQAVRPLERVYVPAGQFWHAVVLKVLPDSNFAMNPSGQLLQSHTPPPRILSDVVLIRS